MPFEPSDFLKKLQGLKDTKPSIEVASHWLLFHRANATQIVNIWAEELAKVLPEKQLIYLYLANDVIQRCMDKNQEFTLPFKAVLPGCFQSIFAAFNAPLKLKVRRIIDVWRDRCVFDGAFLDILLANGQLLSIDTFCAVNTALHGQPFIGTSATLHASSIVSMYSDLFNAELARKDAVVAVNNIPASLRGISPYQAETTAAQINAASPEDRLIAKNAYERHVSSIQHETRICTFIVLALQRLLQEQEGQLADLRIQREGCDMVIGQLDRAAADTTADGPAMSIAALETQDSPHVSTKDRPELGA